MSQQEQEVEMRKFQFSERGPQEQLSEFLTQFSSFTSLINKIAAYKQKKQVILFEETIAILEKRLSQALANQKDFLAKLSQIYDNTPPSAMQCCSQLRIFKRLRGRLIQNIFPCRELIYSFYNKTETLQRTVNKLEQQIHSLQNGQTLSIVYENLLKIFKAHLDKEKEQINIGLEIKSQKQIESAQRRGTEGCEKIKCKSFSEESSYQKRIRKVLLEIQEGFKTMNCLGMDLDQKHFRSSFFEAKNNKDERYEDFMARNRSINSQIMGYSRSFREFRKRKERKKMAKRLEIMKARKLKTEDYRSYTSNLNSPHHKNLATKNFNPEDDKDRKGYFQSLSRRNYQNSPTKPKKFSIRENPLLPEDTKRCEIAPKIIRLGEEEDCRHKKTFNQIREELRGKKSKENSLFVLKFPQLPFKAKT